MKKIGDVYWCDGGFYFESDTSIRYPTEAAMFRKAHALGLSHVVVEHGFYKPKEGFVVNQRIEPIQRCVPKKYRS